MGAPRKAVSDFERRVRQLLVLIPAARKAEEGLPMARALALTGLRDAADLRRLVLEVQGLEAGSEPGSPHLLAEVEGDRVHVTLEMGFSEPPPFSLREGAALLAAIRPWRDGRRASAAERTARALLKGVPEHLRREVEALSRATDLAVPPPGPWADTLREAVDRHLEVEVEYRSESTGRSDRRALRPRALFARDGHWYLAARDAARDDERLYRLDRMDAALLTERTFVPAPLAALDLSRPGRLYFESGAERSVTLRFAPEVARGARERWGEACRELPGGAIEATLRVTPNEFFWGLVLGWGGAADVVSPPDLAAELRARAAALRARHEGEEGSTA